MRRWAMATASIAFALALLSVLWEGWIAPLRPGGSWLVLKALPLVFLWPGLWQGRLRTYQWTALWCSAYLLEGTMRVTEPAPVRWLAAIEIVLTLALFVAAVRYVRFFPKRPRGR